MALSVDFDSPQTASGQEINITGTVPIGESYIQALQLAVTRSGGTTDYFSMTKEYDNKSGSEPLVVNDTVRMAIVPKKEASDSVTLTSFGSLKAEIVLA